jgi:hypothetical protein
MIEKVVVDCLKATLRGPGIFATSRDFIFVEKTIVYEKHSKTYSQALCH